jgi:hypothetical protein
LFACLFVCLFVSDGVLSFFLDWPPVTVLPTSASQVLELQAPICRIFIGVSHIGIQYLCSRPQLLRLQTPKTKQSFNISYITGVSDLIKLALCVPRTQECKLFLSGRKLQEIRLSSGASPEPVLKTGLPWESAGFEQPRVW